MKKGSKFSQTIHKKQPISHPNTPLFANLNIYADIFFSKSQRIPTSLPRPTRAKPAKKASPSTTRHQILSWSISFRMALASFFLINYRQHRFRHLDATHRKKTTTIKNPTFFNSFCRYLPNRAANIEFNLETGKTIQITPTFQDDFFEEIIGGSKVGWCSEPVLYFTEEVLEGEGLLKWLDKIANSKLFEYNCDSEDNLLWYCSKTFRPLSHALANQLEKQIFRSYHQKNHNFAEIEELREFLTKNNKSLLVEALEITLSQFLEKPEKDLNKLLQKIRIEEDKLHAINAERLFLQMENETKIKRSRRKGRKRKENSSNKPQGTTMQQSPISSILESDESKVYNQSPTKSQLLDRNAQQSILSPIQDNDDQEFIVQNNSISPLAIIQPEKDEGSLKQCQSEHHQSTNQNQRSISKSESTSHLDETFHHQELPNNHHISDEIKEEKIRKRRKRRVKKQLQALQELRTQICHKFMTRQLENISQIINTSTNKMLQARVMAFQRVRILIQNNYSFSNAVLFGSNAIGLALPSSDVDILVVGFQVTTRADCGELLKHIGYVISCMEWAVSCELYANAKVPVLKLEIDTSIPFMQLKGAKRINNSYQHFELQTEKQMIVKVDITINVEGISSGGYQSTLLMKKWLQKFPFAQKIVILFKHLLSYRHLNENYRGGIGSYCLFVMILAYIQQNPKSIQNEISRTFVDLLVWYSETFNNEKQIVWLREDGPSFVSQDEYHKLFDDVEERKGILRLVDPTTSRIMSGSCSQYVKIKEFFKEILQKFSSIEDMIDQQLKNTSQNHAELSRMFQNRRQSEKWLKNTEQKHSWALMNLMGVHL